MRDRDHRRYKELLGAHVLGHLDEPENSELRHHLEGCAECRAEEAGLRAVLADLPAGPAVDLSLAGTEPSPGLEERVLAATEDPRDQRRTRRRFAAGLAAAAVLVATLAVAVFVDLPVDTGPPGLGDVEEISFTEVPDDVTVDGSVVAHTWGTEVILEMEGLEDGELYTAEVEREDGDPASAGTFIGDGDLLVECILNGAVLREDAQAVSVTDSDGEVVLYSELEPRSAGEVARGG